MNNDPLASADFRDLQIAIDSPLVTNGDTIEVFSGIGPYVCPAEGSNRSFRFNGKAITVRARAGQTVVLTSTGDPLDGPFVWNISHGEGRDSILQGFVIRGNSAGGAIIASGATIRNCRITGYGRGGVVVARSGALFEDCDIVQFSSDLGTGLTSTGATFRRCLFAENYAMSDAYAVLGAQVTLFEECIFTGNFPAGSGVPNYFINSGPSRFVACRFTGISEASLAGPNAIFNNSASTELIGCVFDANRVGRIFWNRGPYTMVNCVVWGNSMRASLFASEEGPFVMLNSTVVDNSAPVLVPASSVTWTTIRNSILWNPSFGVGAINPALNIEYSLVRGGFAGAGNIGSDPMFVYSGSCYYQLGASSPAIDAADNAVVPASVLIDFCGLPRFHDDPGTPDTGVGPGPVCDMGAHEFQGVSGCEPDLTGPSTPGLPGYGMPNGALNIDDFVYFLAQFAASNLAVADLTTWAIVGQPGYGVPNGILNNDDFFYYLTIFAAGC